ncbi:hypothetical protein OT109_07490 [Phycisphaeraceae bacterium D3-23]
MRLLDYLPLTVLFSVSCVALWGCQSDTSAVADEPAAVADGPDTGGLDTEPGLRLRLYDIGADYDPTRPLQPGQSPNVDVTLPAAQVTGEEGWLTPEDGEPISDYFIAEYTGWIHIETAGVYMIRAQTEAAHRIQLDDRSTAKDSIRLETGWHQLRVLQWVKEQEDVPLEIVWSLPGDNDLAGSAIDADMLRAPAFYFRPTQAGHKQLTTGDERPGLGKKLTGVHPGYRLTNIRPQGMPMPVGALGMLSDGRLVVARFDAETLRAPRPTEEPNGELWLLTNPTAEDRDDIIGEKIAEGLYEPSGMCILDDVIYISQRSEVSRFTYNEADDVWAKDVVATGWETNDFHQISAGLPHIPGPTPDHPGFFYIGRGTGLGLMRNPPNHGSVWLVDLSKPAGENITPLTGGHRTPNGIGLNATGEAFVIDNQGEWTPANELNHVQEGHFYGFYQPHDPPHAYASPYQPEDRETGVVTQAAVLLPQDEIGNSPTQPLLFPDGHTFEGQLALPDMRYGGINRVFLEEVNGVWQGCAMRFTQGLEAGPNRIFFGPDGSLYVGGIGGRHASTWYWNDARNRPTYQGLERLTPTGEDVFEILSMSATPDGFVLTFTQPVSQRTLEALSGYRVSQWTYRATRGYGGPKIDTQSVRVTRAVASDDGRSVRLTIPGLRPGYVVHLRTDPVSERGQAIWSGEVWYTLNGVPE